MKAKDETKKTYTALNRRNILLASTTLAAASVLGASVQTMCSANATCAIRP